MPATTPGGLPYPLPDEPVADGADAIKNLATEIDTRFSRTSGRATLAAQTLNNSGTFAQLAFTLNDATGGVTFATDQFTILTEGAFVVSAYVVYGTGSTGHCGHGIYLGGSNLGGTTIPYAAGSSQRITVSVVRFLTVGSVISVRAFQTRGTALTMAAGDGNLSLIRIPETVYITGGE